MIEIAQFLPISALSRLASSSKQWRSALRSDDLWLRLRARDLHCLDQSDVTALLAVSLQSLPPFDVAPFLRNLPQAPVGEWNSGSWAFSVGESLIATSPKPTRQIVSFINTSGILVLRLIRSATAGCGSQ